MTADEPYLQESMRKPTAAIVKGFQPIMPPFPSLTDAEVDAMLDAIKASR